MSHATEIQDVSDRSKKKVLKMKPEAVDAIEAMELEPQKTIAEMKTDDHDLEMLLDSEPETFTTFSSDKKCPLIQ